MIFENGSWGKTQYLLERSMDVEMLRRKVIADNIANADVPHFKRSEVSFEASLRRAMESQEYAKKEAVPAKVSDERHIRFFTPIATKSVQPRTHIDYLSTMRNDGNNVDPEKEVQDMLKNQLRYQAMSQSVSHNFRLLQVVMRAP